MDFLKQISDDLVHIARLGLSGRPQDVQAYLRQSVRRLRKQRPDLATELSQLLALGPNALSPLRDVGGQFVPVDTDTRLALVKSEYPVVLSSDPILDDDLKVRLDQVVAERRHLAALEAQGLGPTRSLLFVGPPGVGKTMCARWLAARLDRPLIILDLATVMSSFLGKTGANIRSVLDYAKSVESVLLLDEFDSVAKKRDDDGDVGELKRLVTVLLQEVDDWPSTSLLVAATNHGELLDPAVWRRFDDVLKFRAPNAAERAEAIRSLFGNDAAIAEGWIALLVSLWEGRSFSDLTREVQWLRRRATVAGQPIGDLLVDRIGQEMRSGSPAQRKQAAHLLAASGLSDRKISEIVGISRDTIRKSRSEWSKPRGRRGEENEQSALLDRSRGAAIR